MGRAEHVGVYASLGVRPVINARGVNTMAGGSLMPPAVLEVMTSASTVFVDLAELQAGAAARIAGLAGAEAAAITAGSSAGMLVAASACMAGTDPASIRQLPDTTGLRDEIVIQACQRFQYDQALRTAGAQLVEAGNAIDCTVPALEAVIGPRTAALVYVVYPPIANRGLTFEELVGVARRAGLPVIVDAAAALPPVRHLTFWTERGADLVIFSGGKGVRGPAATGFILGRADLIAAVVANCAPNTAIGRVCKVGKEEIIGLVRAFELFLEHDHAGERARHHDECHYVVASMARLPGVRGRVVDDDRYWPSPAALIEIDERMTGLTPAAVLAALRRGEPPIMTRIYPPNDPNGALCIDPHCLRDGEIEIVVRRLTAELKQAAPAPA